MYMRVFYVGVKLFSMLIRFPTTLTKKKILYVGREFAKYDLHFLHSVFLQGPLINFFEFIHLNCSTLQK